MALLEVANVRRSFGGLVAVDGVSLTGDPGPDQRRDRPQRRGQDHPVQHDLRPAEAGHGPNHLQGPADHRLEALPDRRAGISRTFQNPSLFLQMTVLENVMVGRHSRTRWDFFGCGLRLPGQRAEERAIRDAALRAAGVRRPGAPGRLAGRRAGLRPAPHGRTGARAGHRTGAAAAGRAGQRTEHHAKRRTSAILIRRIRDRGITILLVEHDMSMVMELSDDILVLHNGAPSPRARRRSCRTIPEVISVYLGGEFRACCCRSKI